jgi:hypothetical protein
MKTANAATTVVAGRWEPKQTPAKDTMSLAGVLRSLAEHVRDREHNPGDERG